MHSIAGELHLRVFLVRAVVLEDEVHDARAMGLKVAYFVP